MRPLPTRYKTALARAAAAPVLAGRRLAGRGPDVEAKRRGIRWRLDLTEGIDFAIWLLGSFEPGTRRAYAQMIEPGAVVVDVGANIGAHTLQFASLVGPKGRVVAVEPTGFAFGKLTENLRLNPGLEDRVTAVQAMLMASGDEAPPGELFASWPLRAGSDLHPKHRGSAQSTSGAHGTTLDRLVADLTLDGVDLIKIDVDGQEPGVLRGGLETLRGHRPIVLMELSPYVLEEAGSSVDELVELLAAARYELRDLRSGGPLPDEPGALADLVPDGGSINVLARPR
jgi:FkbM family methyltransferase